MASAVFGAKLRTWMSKMRGGSSNNNGTNSKDSSPTKDNQLFDFDTAGCGAESGAFSLFGRPCSTNNNNNNNNNVSSKQSKKARKRRKLNCMTVSNSQSFDRIRQQLYEEEYGQLDSPKGNSSASGKSGGGAGGCATAPWDPRVPPYHPQFARTPARVDVIAKRGFQAPRSVSLSSPESAYGSGNSEDSLTPASSTHPDLHHHHFPGRQFLLPSGHSSYSSLRQHSNLNVTNGTGSTGSTRSVDRPKIKTNPWVSFQRQLQMQQQQEQQQQQKPQPNERQSLNLKQQTQDESPKQGQNVARAQSLSFRDRPVNQAKRAQSFRSPLFAGNRLKKISSESESEWDEEEERGKDKKASAADDAGEDEDPHIDNASSSAEAVCGSSKMNKSLTGSVSASPMKSLTFAGEKGFMTQFAKYNSKAMMLLKPDGRVRAGSSGKTVNCPNCFLMSRHHLGRKHRCQPKPALDSQLCAYCRSWILAEEDSSTDVDTDSDFNETGSTTSSSSCSPVGAGRSKKRLPLSAYQFGAAARRRRWRKTLPAPSRNLSKELSTSCSSFLFEGDFGNDRSRNKPKPTAGEGNQVEKTRLSSSDSEDDASSTANTRSSGNGNRSAMVSTSTPKEAVAVTSRSALTTPLRQKDTFWVRQLSQEAEYCVSRYEAPSATSTTTKSLEDPIGYKTLLSSMEALMAKFTDPGSPAAKTGTGYMPTRPKSSDTILDKFGADMPPWCTSTPQQEQRLPQADSSFISLNQGFSSRSSLGLTANGSSCDTLTEVPAAAQQATNGANFVSRSSSSSSRNYFNMDAANGNNAREADWANGNVKELSPLKDLSSPMGSIEAGSVVGYTRKPADFRSRYTEEPLIKCRVEEENDDPLLEALHLPQHLQNQAEDPLGGSSGDRRSFNSLEEKLKKLRQERMLLEAKIREARDEDRRRRKEKTSL